MHRRTLLIFLLACISFHCISQQNFLQLKKHDRTIKTFFKGSYITFQTDGYQWLTGRIYKVTNDSVYLYQINVRMVPNAWGLGSVADTSVLGVVPLSMKNIRAIPNEHRSIVPLIGSLFQIGAVGFTGLNLINSVVNKEAVFDNRNKKRLGGAGIAFILGTLLKKADPEVYTLGKKYKLVFINAEQ